MSLCPAISLLFHANILVASLPHGSLESFFDRAYPCSPRELPACSGTGCPGGSFHCSRASASGSNGIGSGRWVKWPGRQIRRQPGPRLVRPAPRAGARPGGEEWYWRGLGARGLRLGDGRASAGTWTWAACDSLISDTVSAGLNPLMTFQYSVPWCTTAPDPGLPVSTISYYPPCDYDQYEDFLKHLVSRYGPKANGYTDGGPGYGQNVVHSWEVGNEPDIKGSFILPPSMLESSAASVYAEFLYHAWHAIKSADPTAQVVFGGLALNLSGDPRINR